MYIVHYSWAPLNKGNICFTVTEQNEQIKERNYFEKTDLEQAIQLKTFVNDRKTKDPAGGPC